MGVASGFEGIFNQPDFEALRRVKRDTHNIKPATQGFPLELPQILLGSLDDPPLFVGSDSFFGWAREPGKFWSSLPQRPRWALPTPPSRVLRRLNGRASFALLQYILLGADTNRPEFRRVRQGPDSPIRPAVSIERKLPSRHVDALSKPARDISIGLTNSL